MSARDAWEILEWDWAQTATGYVLHHVKSLVNAQRFDEHRGGKGTTTCGVRSRLNVPGLFSRMGENRCKKCCRILSVPSGVGSPKNDAELSAWAKKRVESLIW